MQPSISQYNAAIVPVCGVFFAVIVPSCFTINVFPSGDFTLYCPPSTPSTVHLSPNAVSNLPLLTTNSPQHTHSGNYTPQHHHHSSSSNNNIDDIIFDSYIKETIENYSTTMTCESNEKLVYPSEIYKKCSKTDVDFSESEIGIINNNNKFHRSDYIK